MPSAYEALPTTYPPSHPTNPSLTSTFRTFGIFNVCHDRPDPNSVSGSRDKQRRRIGPATTLKFIILPIAFFLILHTLIISAFPSSAYSTKYASYWAGSVGKTGHSDYAAATLAADAVWSRLDPSAGQPGAFFRDSYPIRTMLAFWDLAEREVQARQVDTCRGQLGREFIDAYQRTELDYCLAPDAAGGFVPGTIRNDSLSPHWDPSIPVPPTRITCVAVQRDSFSDWWPYPAAPCLSTDLRAVREDERRFHAADCELTDDGKALKGEMGSERFLGADAELVREGTGSCKERVERTLLVVGRQDQWNPFHVAEDLITTLVTVFIAARVAPALINTRLQLVFSEGFGMDSNHFTPLWDRMGAWAPRRLSLDPWGEGVCLTNTIHSIGAGASLLSAMGVGTSYPCASTITWAASHYYRHLFGLLPPSLSLPANLLESYHLSARPRRPINVLWVSRAKLDSYAQKHNDWSIWRDVRHIDNEPELIARLRSGLSGLCGGNGSWCQFEDALDVPEAWALISPDTIPGDNSPLPIRFAMLDPTVHAPETQIHFVGHSTILIASHGGALGLCLFLPPGDATVLELQVDSVEGNYHFQHMATQMGQQYEQLKISRTVDVEQVWSAVEGWVRKISLSG